MKGNTGARGVVDARSGVSRQVSQILADTEACFLELDRIRAEWSQLSQQWAQLSQTRQDTAQRLSAETRQLRVEIGRITSKCWPCFQQFDFWHPDQERAFGDVFQEIVDRLYPEDPDAPEQPFLRELRGLLLRALAVCGSGAEKCRQGDDVPSREPSAQQPASATPRGCRIPTRAPAGPAGQTLSPKEFYSVGEVAQRWGVSDDTVREQFAKEPDVMALGRDRGRGRRQYKTLRIPKAVLERVERRRSNA